MIILPKPKKMVVNQGELCIENLRCENARFRAYAPSLFGEKGVTVSFKKEKAYAKEQYKIVVGETGILIYHSTREGAYRAISTLKQIVRQNKGGYIPFLTVEDAPDFENRGYMLDISRGKVPKMASLKKLIKRLADLKYNQLQLYMDSFVFEYESFPAYCEAGTYLSKKQIAELTAYCKKHFIALVPNQNGFGHMEAWTAKSELSHLAITGKDGKASPTLNPLKAETLEFIDKVYGDVLKAFSSSVINIGMDEPLELGLNETKAECDKRSVGEVYTEYLNKVCMLLSEKYGKTPMFWDDIIFRHPEQLENIPKNAIVMDWGYEEQSPFERNCRQLAEQGRRFYVCPGSSTWLTFTGRSHNAMLNISAAAEVGKYYGAEGFLLTEWGDGGNPQFPAISYFAMVFGGAVAWNAGSHICDEAFNARRDLAEDCHYYVDKYFYQTKGENSLSKLVYRMGNYYLLEDGLCFNHSEIVRYGYGYTDEAPTQAKREAFKRVAKYMQRLKQELRSVHANANVKRQIRANAEMVIITALALAYGKNENTLIRLQALKKEYGKLWRQDNLEKGVELFLSRLDTFAETYL